jgi:hypothetical protein
VNATLQFLGLTRNDYDAPPPAEWTPETLEVALRRLRGLAGAQIRLHGADPMLPGGKDVVLCGHERTLAGGELLVDHVEWQVSHLYLFDRPDLFEGTIDQLIQIDLAGSGTRTAGPRLSTDSGWPISLELELISADGASLRRRIGDVRGDEPLAPIARGLMAAVDDAVAAGTALESRGPRIESGIARCFAHAIRQALIASVRGRSSWFDDALLAAARGDLSARAALARPWPPTNSGVERAQGAAALFLLGAAPPGPDPFPWHQAPGQPGARLRRLVDLALSGSGTG